MMACCAIAGLPACSDDEEPGTVVPAPSKGSVVSDIDIITASFSWDKVPEASQYGVVLKDIEGDPIDATVVKDTSVTFENLTPSTKYSIDITAYHTYDGAIESTPVTTIDFQTLDPIVLDTPEIKSHKKQGSLYKVTLNEVENATSYEFECKNMESGAVTTGSSVTYTIMIKGLTAGDYEFKAKAVNPEPQYSDSQWSETIQFKF